MVYQWKVSIYKVDAQKAGEELERITTEIGSLRPENVVDASRDPGAVLHDCFEWNDAIAAEEHRRHQARGIIQNVVVVNLSGAETEHPVRAFVNIQNDYKPVEQVLAKAEYKNEMLANAMNELNSFRRKYATLEQLTGLFSEIDKLRRVSGL